MKRLYFDTETTGFPQKAGTPLDKCPFILQLAAVLVDDEDGEIASFKTLIKPDGEFTIDEGAEKAHGISKDMVLRYGIAPRTAMANFSQLCRVSEQVVAHNIQFDKKLIAYELERLNAVNVMEEREQFCTMLATMDLCKLPGRYGQYKWPKLIEAHEILLGEGFDGAHDALVDVLACQRIHKHLISNNLIK